MGKRYLGERGRGPGPLESKLFLVLPTENVEIYTVFKKNEGSEQENAEVSMLIDMNTC